MQPETQYGRQRYDAFGRQLQTFDVDGTITLQSRYHALSTDLYDAADLYPGPHQGSYASTRTDGHGRTVETTERVHDAGTLSKRYVRTQYLPTGEPTVISREGPGTTVKRWMRYDSLGRLVLNVDPHTTANFKDDTSTQPSATTGGMRPWIYAYNDAGDLVATSDARGCGQNFFYDGAGRLYGEDYSPCNAYHWFYTAPNVGSTPYDISTVTGAQNAFEVFYQYDSVPAAPVAPPTTGDGYPTATDANKFLKGKLAAVHDRAATTWFVYDGLGRTTQTFRKVSYTGAKDMPTFAGRLVNRWYQKRFYYDAADRSIEETTGVASAELKATGGASSVKPKYTRRGTIKSVGSSYGDLVKKITRTAEGMVTDVTLGDAATTTTHSDFDSRRRLRSVQTYRGSAPLWSSSPAGISPAPAANQPEPTLQLLLQDLDYSYDVVGNPTEIRDWRTADEWPASAKPVTRRMEYDDLYRVTRVDYEYPGGFDAWKSPHAADMPSSNDQRRPKPIGMRTFANRPLWQTFKYDWLGNTTFTDDDQHALLDRSLGKITSNATTDTTKPRPYQFYQADSVPGSTVQIVRAANYDDAGNLTWLTSGRNTVPCTLQTDCQNLQYFYTWDEVGRLQAASKVQSGWGETPYNPQKDSLFLYDYSDERVVKDYAEYNYQTSTKSPSSTTLYIFDSLEVRRAPFNTSTKQYLVDSTTEVGYLAANGMRLGRLHYEPVGKGEPQLVTPDANHSSNLHVLLNLPDHLGSSSLIIDHATGELVEARTYQPYGATESDYRPERWKGFREDYGFTGKEEDVDLGLIYFGKRYLNPFLGRWMNADPLAVHVPGEADLNLYAYVFGRILKDTDPLGLTGPPPGNPPMENVEGAGPGPSPAQPSGPKAQPAPEKPPTTALQFTSYPDKVRAAVGQATAKCGDGVCQFGGFIATMAGTAITFPGDLANTLNTGARSVDSFRDGHPVRGTLEGLQVAGNVLFLRQIVHTGAELLGAGTSAAGGNGRGFSYSRSANPQMLAQTTENGCGGACATQWLADQGINRRLQLPEPSMGHEIAKEMGSGYIGGSFTKPEAVLNSGKTFMAHVSNVPNKNGHWVLIDKIENGTVVGRDPWGLAGLASDSGTSIEMSLHYFREIWAKGGYAGVFKVH